MAQQNTAQLWDNVWARSPSIDKDLYAVAKEERLIRWQRMESKILARFGSFENLAIIELGAGRGTNAALMAGRGARVTVLDYSESALERSRRLFERLELPVELVLQDALDLPTELLGKYDVSMSFGLAEHFLGEPRSAILKAHFDVLRDGGLAFISVPNAHNPPYRLYKWITERTGRWSIGEEYPFARAELESCCTKLGIEEFGFFGDSLWRSKKFLNPIKWFPRRKKKRGSASADTPTDATTGREAAPASGDPAATQAPWPSGGPGSTQTASPSSESARRRTSPSDAPSAPSLRTQGKRRYRRLPRRENGTRWDDRYSYALVLWGVKSAQSGPT